MTTAVHMVVRGLVQGVGFRYFVRESARRLGVAGWVANRDDGAVEIVAAGADAALSAFQHRVRGGPPGAVVEQVEENMHTDAEPLPNPFTIRR